MDAQAGMLARLFERSMGLGDEWEVSDVWFEPCQYNGQRNRRFLHGQHVFRTVPEGPLEAVEELLHGLCRHAVPDGLVRTVAVVV